MLRISFLNVGHGDCTVIEHPSGRITVVDINNGGQFDETSAEELSAVVGAKRPSPIERVLNPRATGSALALCGYSLRLTDPIAFLSGILSTAQIHRYIQTHPDLDHMRGLVALREARIPICNFWDTRHDKEPDFISESDRREWAEYQRLTNGNAGPKVLRLLRGSQGEFWSQDPSGPQGADQIEILAPTKAFVDSYGDLGNSNNLSYVLRVSHAGRSVILGGDAEADVWEDIAKSYGTRLKCDVLKASHHGRDSGYHQRAASLMNPEYTIVSVGKKPETDASNKYRHYSTQAVWSTRWKGDITLTIEDDGQATIQGSSSR